MAAAGEQLSVRVNRFLVRITPGGVVEPAVTDEEAFLPGFLCFTEDPARRTASEALLLALGCNGSAYAEVDAPTAEQAARFTDAAAARVCRLLTHGLLTERFAAAYVLSAHALLPPGAVPALESPATLDALCVAAVSNAYIPQPADHPLAEERREADWTF